MDNSNNNKIISIRNRLKNKNKNEYPLVDTWDFLMASYNCWIPWEEFLNLDVELVNELVDRINLRNKEYNKNNKKK